MRIVATDAGALAILFASTAVSQSFPNRATGTLPTPK